MRLIDADIENERLLDFIAQNDDGIQYAVEHKDMTILEDIFFDYFNEQKTAFDLESVIEQIENIMKDDSIRFCDQAVQAAVNILKSAANATNGKNCRRGIGMTENEAIMRVREFGLHHAIGDFPNSVLTVKAFEIAIKALEEIQQYRSIGTVKECHEAVDKQTAKKPNLWGDGNDSNGEIIYDMYDCPNCGKEYELDYEEHKHCPNCGQAIDWSDYNG